MDYESWKSNCSITLSCGEGLGLGICLELQVWLLVLLDLTEPKWHQSIRNCIYRKSSIDIISIHHALHHPVMTISFNLDRALVLRLLRHTELKVTSVAVHDKYVHFSTDSAQCMDCRADVLRRFDFCMTH